MTNNRAATRARTLKGARIVLNDGWSAIDCVVRNLSATGARLKVENSVCLPENFVLKLSDETVYACEIRWRQLNEVGVEFKGTPTGLMRWRK